jgi:hypothetical protein
MDRRTQSAIFTAAAEHVLGGMLFNSVALARAARSCTRRQSFIPEYIDLQRRFNDAMAPVKHRSAVCSDFLPAGPEHRALALLLAAEMARTGDL